MYFIELISTFLQLLWQLPMKCQILMSLMYYTLTQHCHLCHNDVNALIPQIIIHPGLILFVEGSIHKGSEMIYFRFWVFIYHYTDLGEPYKIAATVFWLVIWSIRFYIISCAKEGCYLHVEAPYAARRAKCAIEYRSHCQRLSWTVLHCPWKPSKVRACRMERKQTSSLY